MSNHWFKPLLRAASPGGGTGGHLRCPSAQVPNDPFELMAFKMLDAFMSVGAGPFDIVVTDINKRKLGYWEGRSDYKIRQEIGPILWAANKYNQNTIIRPHSEGLTLVQLDDLGPVQMERVKPGTFLVIRTSPNSFQAWVGLSDGDQTFEQRLKRGVGADPGANGSARIAGSLNCKPKYQPHYPMVEVVHTSSGRMVNRTYLESLGLLAPPLPDQKAERAPGAEGPPCASPVGKSPLKWPNYQWCLQEKKGDRSEADWDFAWKALDRGWDMEEVTERLMGLSGKAQEKGQRGGLEYVLQTVEKAARSVAQRRPQNGPRKA